MNKKVLSAMLIAGLLLNTTSSVMAYESNNVISYNTILSTSSYDPQQVEKELVSFLNENLKYGKSNIDNLITDFYNSKNQNALTDMFKRLSKNQIDETRDYLLVNGQKIQFYNDGTFNITNAPIVQQEITYNTNMMRASLSTASSADSYEFNTGKFEIHGTRYGWFGLKLYTLYSEGSYTYENGKVTANAYKGWINKHFAGGVFSPQTPDNDAFVNKVAEEPHEIWNAGFSTSCSISLGLEIKGIGYSTSHTAKLSNYLLFNATTGEKIITDTVTDIEIYD